MQCVSSLRITFKVDCSCAYSSCGCFKPVFDHTEIKHSFIHSFIHCSCQCLYERADVRNSNSAMCSYGIHLQVYS